MCALRARRCSQWGLPIFAYLAWSARQAGLKERAINIAVFVLLGLLIIILPVTVRNYLVGKDFVLIASQGGINFYIGNNPYADGYSASLPELLGPRWESSDVTFFVERQIGHKPKPSEESSFFYAQAFKFIQEQPMDFLRLLLKKTYLFWNHYEIPNNQNIYFMSRYSPLLMQNPLGFGVV